MTDQQLLEDIAAQLRQPCGEKGLEIAEMMHQTNIAMTLHSIQALDLQDQLHILELGHGNAAHVPQLLQQKKQLHYTGLEISELMQQQALQLNATFVTQQQAQFALYDGQHIPAADASFDRIFTVNTLYFWQHPHAFLNELYRVLKPLGLLNITFAVKDFMQTLPFTHYQFDLYDLEKMITLVEQTDFHIKHHAAATDIVKSKMGDLVERHFMTVTLAK